MEYSTVILNFVYAIIGGILTIVFMISGYKIFDNMTHFNEAEELQNGNIAVGIVIAGIFIGIGIAVGLVIGMGLN